MTLHIYPSTNKLAKKFLMPIVAIIGIYFFVVVPDEDIGVGSGGFLTFMTVTLSATCIGLLIAYFYQLKISKTKPILSIYKNHAFFSRKKIKVNFAPEIVFTASEASAETPPSDADDMDFLIDKKESYIYVWKNDKKAAKIRATFMNLDSKMIAALLNDLNGTSEEERGKTLESFHSILTEKASEAVKGRILLEKS